MIDQYNKHEILYINANMDFNLNDVKKNLQ